MIKNVSVYSDKDIKISKKDVHALISKLRNDLTFVIEGVSINFISKEEIQSVNIEYLNHDYTTDIITLSYSGNPKIVDTEIFISYLDASENAEKFGVSLNSELIRLVIHGILHVTGYDDTTEKFKKEMKKIENKLVDNYSNVFKLIN